MSCRYNSEPLWKLKYRQEYQAESNGLEDCCVDFRHCWYLVWHVQAYTEKRHQRPWKWRTGNDLRIQFYSFLSVKWIANCMFSVSVTCWGMWKWKREKKKEETGKISQKAICYGLVKKKKTERNSNDLGVVCRSLDVKTDYQIQVSLPKTKNPNL